jgi:hypothetical protein
MLGQLQCQLQLPGQCEVPEEMVTALSSQLHPRILNLLPGQQGSHQCTGQELQEQSVTTQQTRPTAGFSEQGHLRPERRLAL